MKSKINRVLLIDDDDATNFLNRHVIENADISNEILTVSNGKEAMDFLTGSGKYHQNTDASPEPMLILLDINMPVMDGWEFLEEYQNLPEELKCHTIIILITTSLNPDDQIRAEKINELSGYKNKPLTPEMLDEIVRKHFADTN